MTIRERIQSLIRDVPDFPKPGVVYKDLTPVFESAEVHQGMVEAFAERYRGLKAEGVVAVESRGFLVGAPLAVSLGVPLALVRKHGKLPRETFTETYELEYGHDRVQMHVDAVKEGQRVVLVDDLLATGGTSRAARDLVEKAGGVVLEAAFIVELAFLSGRKNLGCEVFSLVHYD